MASSSSYSSATLFNSSPKCYNFNSSPPFNTFSSSSSSTSSASDNRQGHNCKFISFSGVRNLWKHQNLRAHAMNATEGSVASRKSIINVNDEPDHLLVLVHGIMGSPSDWTYFEAELKRRLGRNFLIYASASNTSTKTFSGIDEAGKRLADEVMQIVEKTQSLKKISFLAHSLGGLFSRYAIAVLYTPNISTQSDSIADSSYGNSNAPGLSSKGLIAGLEPINFITLATPHLGVRGKKQLIVLYVSASFSTGTPLIGETCSISRSHICWPNWSSTLPH